MSAVAFTPCKAAPVSVTALVASLTDVRVSVGGRLLAGPLSLTIRKGEFVGVLGPNGAGKTLLLALLNATLRPASGSVELLHQAPWCVGEFVRARLRQSVGTVLQRDHFNALPPLTAWDVAAMGRIGERDWLGRLRSKARAQVDAALEHMGVRHLASRAYRSLSGGEQQKVQLARALAQDPALLLLDEPTTGLDPDWQARITETIHYLGTHGGKTVVMTTHLLDHLPRCCGRVLLMSGGKLLFDGPSSEALTPPRLRALFDRGPSVVPGGCQ